MMRLTTFGRVEAAHLLRRLQFGVTPAEIDRAVQDGLEATLDRLFTPQPETAEFQAAEAVFRATALATSNLEDLQVWWLYRMLGTANPVVEKLAFAWHNQFATSFAKVNSVGMMLAQNELFRKLGTGPFAPLLHAIARDPAMLVWLDGNANRKRHPNENFAREVMELFALGRGAYTEHDIQEAARAFSGWQLHDGQFWLNTSQHDPGVKTIFGRSGNFNGSDVIDLCLAQPACARFLADRLVRTFVAPSVFGVVLNEIAEDLQRNQLNLLQSLRTICASEEFYGDDLRGSLIKSPVELVLGTLRPFTTGIRWPAVRQVLNDLGQSVFAPPSVKGWDGGRQWVHAMGWIQRWNFLTAVTSSGQYARWQSPTPHTASDWQTALFSTPLDDATRTALANAGDQWPALAFALPEYQLM